MAGRALNVARIQRVINTCWLSKSLGQLPASAPQRMREVQIGVCLCVCVCVCVCVWVQVHVKEHERVRAIANIQHSITHLIRVLHQPHEEF